jgi:glycosyltransferase involved in cell wall biosynthesis
MISVVVPMYNEEDNVEPLHDKIKKVLSEMEAGKEHEIIFVDDGSEDKTFENLLNLKVHSKSKDEKVKIIKFRKNFGQSAALKAGFDYATGDVIITMDGDLQNDPEDIPKLIAKMNEGYDVVSGWRADRNDPLMKKILSRFSNWLHKKLTGIDIHDSGCSLKAYKGAIVKDLELYGETHRYIPAMLSWQGYRIGEVKVQHHARKYGKTKYGWRRLIKGLLDILNISFWQRYHARPLHLIGGFGILTFGSGFLIGLYLTIQRLFFGVGLADRPLLLLAVLLVILGIQFVTFGFLAEITIRNYFNAPNRQTYNIKEIVE